MADESPKETTSKDTLKGTTYRVYRYMLKNRTPVGISKVQKALGLSSSSVSEYHIKKLLRVGLIKEEGGGYVIDKVVFENIVKIRSLSIPTQTAYAVFFGATLILLVTVLRPETFSSLFFFSLGINCTALGVAIYEAAKTFRRI